MVKNVLLVRHGQSKGNVIEVAHENTDPDEQSFHEINWDADDWDLTDTGREQSIHTGEFLRSRDIGGDDTDVWTSPMRRARQTTRHLGLTAVEQVVFPLYERKTVNISFMDIRQAVREASTERQARAIAMRGTFGDRVEPFEAMIDRIAPSVEKISTVGAENLVVVSHGYVMLGFRALLENLDDERITDIFRGNMSNTTVKRRPTNNGDVIVYRRNPITGLCESKQHFGPMDQYVGDVVDITLTTREL